MMEDILRSSALVSVLAFFSWSGAANAEIVEQSDRGFVVKHQVEIPAEPFEAYNMLRSPAIWWSADHSFSGNAENFYMDAQAGGCFCELLPVSEGAPEGTQRGSVEHMRIVYAEPGKALRMRGALGPLQSEPLTGVLTIVFKPEGDGTQVTFEYVVGGYMRFRPDDIVPAVDAVIGEQSVRFARLFETGAGEPKSPGAADK